MIGHECIRAALVALLTTVPGIGCLHSYERFSEDSRELQALYLQGNEIRGFHIRRQSWREMPYSSTRNKVRTRWLIRGFASRVDARGSELAFDSLLDDIATAVRAKPVLYDANGNALCHTVTDEGASLQLEESGPVMFADVWCHSATFSLSTEHLEENECFISDPMASPDPSAPNNPAPGERECPYMIAVIHPSNVAAPAAALKKPFGAEGDTNG